MDRTFDAPDLDDCPRNSPRAAGRIVALALLANGTVKPSEWAALHRQDAAQRLGLSEQAWRDLLADVALYLPDAERPGAPGIDQRLILRWLAAVDELPLQRLVLALCAATVSADGDVDHNEARLLRGALAQWVVPPEDQAQVEPLLYGLDFQVLPRRLHG